MDFNVGYEYDAQLGETCFLCYKIFYRAFVQLAEVYRNRAHRAQMIRNAVARTKFVSVRRTARNMLELFSQQWDIFQAETDSYNEGRRRAQQALRDQEIDGRKAASILRQLRRSRARFEWKYLRNGSDETMIIRSKRGLVGFLQSYNEIRKLGTVGLWSVFFHILHHGGAGHIIVHLQETYERYSLFLKK